MHSFAKKRNVMLFKLFLTKFKQEVSSGAYCVSLVLLVLKKLVVFLSFLMIGYVFSMIIRQACVGIENISKILLLCVVLDFVIKFFTKNTDVLWLLRYTVLPIKKKRLLPYYIADEVFAIANYNLLAFIFPVLVVCDMSFADSLFLLSFALMVSFFNSMMLRWMGILVDYKFYFWLLPIVFAIGIMGLDYEMIVNEYAFFILFVINVIGYMLMFDYETKNVFQNRISSASKVVSLHTRSVMLNFLFAETFHTSLKKNITMSFFWIVFILFNCHVNEGLCWLVFSLPFFIISVFCDFTFSAEGSSFDGLQSCSKVFLRQLWMFKMNVASLLVVLICPTLMFLIGSTAVDIVSYTIFSVGFIVPLAFLSVVFNNRRVNLYTKGIKGVQQPMQLGTIITVLLVFVTVFLSILSKVYISETICVIIWLVVGTVSLLMRKKIGEMIWKKFDERRYAISASFRKTNSV